jgi:hypothetical protein
MKNEDHSPWVRLLLVGLLLSGACTDESSCPSCTEEIDSSKVVDPRSLGDGSGYPGTTWDRAQDPGTLGWSDIRLRNAEDFAGRIASDAVMVVDRGVVVWEHGNTAKNYIVQSCRKSFLSALYGIFVHDGTIDMGMTMEELGIDDLPPSLTPEEKGATLEHLIMGRSGLLFLRGGRWREQQIVPEEWVERSIVPYSITGSTLDYGYMWWVGDPVDWNGHTLYAALGGSGQAIFVVPDLEVVITHKVDYDSWQGGWANVYDLVRMVFYAKVL